MMNSISASEFKAKCLGLIDRVHETGESVIITKRGKVMARLVSYGTVEERPWRKLKGSGRYVGDPFAPVVDESELDALR